MGFRRTSLGPRLAPWAREQLQALMRACDALSAEPLLKVDYQISLAEWLFCNDFPIADAADQLAAAVDNLMDNEEDSPEPAEEEDE